MNPIAALSASPVIGTSTSGTGGQQQNQHLMQEGQTMHAFVVETTGDKFVLDIGSSRILAQGDSVTLTPGQSLDLEVTATTPQLELKIITNPLQQYLGRSLTVIDRNLDLTALLQVLPQPPNPAAELVPATTLKVLEDFFALQQRPLSGKEGGEVLRQMIDTLGLQLEARLGRGLKEEGGGSLKSALLEIAHLFADSEKIGEAAKTILSTIESFQLSQLHLTQDKNLILPLPFPFLDQGYLLIDQRQEQEQETEGGQQKTQQHFSLHLALTGLGNLQIEFLQTEGGLWMRFNCDSQEKADFVNQFKDDLRQQLADIDIPLQGLSFSGTANDPGTDLLRLLVPPGQSLLDTKV